jgi:hypothetical protein
VSLLLVPFTSAALSAQTSYPSTTTVQPTGGGGPVTVYLNVNYSPLCVNEGDNVIYSATVGNQSESGSSNALEFATYGPGTYPVTGSFSGFYGFDSGGNPCMVESSSGSGTLNIAAPTASQVLISAPDQPIQGAPATISVSVSGADNYTIGPTPTGSVILFNGSTALATLPLTARAGATTSSASLTVPTTGLPAGTYTLNAVYQGDANLSASTATPVSVTLLPYKQPSEVSLDSNSNESYDVGQSATLTAEVDYGLYDSQFAPTGTVTFYTGSTDIGSATLVAYNDGYQLVGRGTLTVNTTGLPIGAYPVVAKYSGDSRFDASTSPQRTVTLSAATVTQGSVSPSSVAPGKTATFTATVTRTGVSGVPTGSVTFSLAGVSLGSANLNSNGVATFSYATTGLAAGSYTIQASYSGDAQDSSSAANITLVIT